LDAENNRIARLLSEHLKQPELHQMGIPFHELCGIRQISQGRCLPARSLERRETFLAGPDDLREDLFQLARKHDVADLHAQELQTENMGLRRPDLLKLRPDLLPRRQQVVDGRATDDLAERELELDVERVAKVLGFVDRDRRIGDFVFGRDAHFQRDAIRAEDFLSGDGLEHRPDIDLSDFGKVLDGPIESGMQNARELPAGVPQTALEFVDHDRSENRSDQSDDQQQTSDELRRGDDLSGVKIRDPRTRRVM